MSSQPPLWKPSYRIIVDAKGTARLQAWAVLENACGEDWHGVSISLTSGKPVTLRRELRHRRAAGHHVERFRAHFWTEQAPNGVWLRVRC